MTMPDTPQSLINSSWQRLVARAVVVAVVIAQPSCTNNPTTLAGKGSVNALGSGSVVRIGDSVIDPSTLLRASVTSRVPTQEALERLVDDRTLALAAQHGLLESGRAQAVERGVLARALIERIARDVRAQGQPTQAEIEREVATRWIRFDRPDAVQVSHFVVRVAKPEDESGALARAEELARRVAGVRDPKTFAESVREIARGDSSVTVESLPPTTVDGRTFLTNAKGEPSGEGPRLDPTFAKAANELDSPGDQSRILRSRFGYHVILLERRVKGLRATDDERRSALDEEVYTQRARARVDDLVASARQKTRILVERSSRELTATVGVSP
jgi:hypothetical protein